MMTAAYFSDSKNKDKSEKEMSEKLLIDDVNNNGSFETNKRKMSGRKSLSINNIEILVDEKIFGPTNNETLHIDLNLSSIDFKAIEKPTLKYSKTFWRIHQKKFFMKNNPLK